MSAPPGLRPHAADTAKLIARANAYVKQITPARNVMLPLYQHSRWCCRYHPYPHWLTAKTAAPKIVMEPAPAQNGQKAPPNTKAPIAKSWCRGPRLRLA